MPAASGHRRNHRIRRFAGDKARNCVWELACNAMREDSRILLKPGTLWPALLRTTERGLASGALQPVVTDYQFIEDRGVRFFVRVLSQLGRKDEARRRELAAPPGRRVNPFLPYEEDLFVAEVSGTHVALLNKFNVVEHHLLIVTREFEDQELLLTPADFKALWACLLEYDGLGFYNGGEAAGASQPHKHLQMVPLPLAPEGPPVPIEPLIDAAVFKEGFGMVPAFPFRHVLGRFSETRGDSPLDLGRTSFDMYRAMLHHLGLRTPEPGRQARQSAPYCLLVTRQWMLLVPRTKEFFNSVSINSLGFAGALLVRNADQMEMLKKTGPMKVLADVAILR